MILPFIPLLFDARSPGVAFGTTDGTFDTITPGPSAEPPGFVEGEGTNQLDFGVAPNPINSFTFEGEESFQARPDETFVVGTFTYENGLIPDLNLDLSDEIYTSNRRCCIKSMS